MKAKELAKILLENPEFEVKACFVDASKCDVDHPWPEYKNCDVSGIADVGHSSRVIILDLDASAVRCKDCGNSTECKSVSRLELYENNYDVRFCEKEKKVVCGTHYCGYGERKTQE